MKKWNTFSYIGTFAVVLSANVGKAMEESKVIEAPLLTNRDFIGELYVEKKGHFILPIHDSFVKATYVQEETLEDWLQGGSRSHWGINRRVVYEYILNLYNKTEQVTPLPASILNADKKLVKVHGNNRGWGNFFKSLGDGHDGLWAVKYLYEIPCLEPQDFKDGTGIYPGVPQTFFTVYLLIKESDVLSFVSKAPLSVQPLQVRSEEPLGGKKRGNKKNMLTLPSSCGKYQTKAKIAQDLYPFLPEAVLNLLPNLSKEHEIRLEDDQFWLFKSGRRVTNFPKL